MKTKQDSGETSGEPSVTGWRVVVYRFDEELLTLEERLLSGKADLSSDEDAVVKHAALHLCSFTGSHREPTPFFVGDEDGPVREDAK